MDQSVKQDLDDYQKFYTNYLVNMESSLSKAGVKLTQSETDLIRNTGKLLTESRFFSVSYKGSSRILLILFILVSLHDSELSLVEYLDIQKDSQLLLK